MESEAIITIRKDSCFKDISNLDNNSTAPGISNNRIMKYPVFTSKKV